MNNVLVAVLWRYIYLADIGCVVTGQSSPAALVDAFSRNSAVN